MPRRLNPNKNKPEQDIVMTPPALAKAIVNYLPLEGDVLDPCRGEGAFLNAIRDLGDNSFVTGNCYCELSEGLDFFNHTQKVDWIVSNPPWSIYRKFCQHAYEIADNIAFLITVNHDLGLKARIRDMEEADFGIKEIIMLDTPIKTEEHWWPQSGFQLGMVWKQKAYKGDIKYTKLKW